MYFIQDNWENWLNFRHTPDTIYLTSILKIQRLYKIFIMMIVRQWNVQTNQHDLPTIMSPNIYTHHTLQLNKGNKVPVFPWYHLTVTSGQYSPGTREATNNSHLFWCGRWNIPVLRANTASADAQPLKSPEHQQSCHWLCRTHNMHCCSTVNFIYWVTPNLR